MKSWKVLLAKNECPEKSGRLRPITLDAIEAEMFWRELAANVEFTISCTSDEKIFDYYRRPYLILIKERKWLKFPPQ